MQADSKPPAAFVPAASMPPKPPADPRGVKRGQEEVGGKKGKGKSALVFLCGWGRARVSYCLRIGKGKKGKTGGQDTASGKCFRCKQLGHKIKDCPNPEAS